MERKPDIQYIHQFYVYGSEAPAIKRQPSRKKSKFTLPLAAPDRSIRISIDPMAICGVAVAVTMLILMTVGVGQYLDTCQEYEQMSAYVIELRNENIRLEQEFQANVDMQSLYDTAIALGMIPVEEAEVVTIENTVPEPEAEPSVWDNIVWFLKGLFA